jgi:ArsR family transcriptional regulator
MATLDRDAGPSGRTLQVLVKLLKLLSEPTRLTVLLVLATHGERTVTDLVKMFPFCQSSISRQLKSLLISGLVQYRRDGKWHYYGLDAARLADLVEQAFAQAAGGPTLEGKGFSLTFKRTRAR